MKRVLMVLAFALSMFTQGLFAADLPTALVDPYLQVQVALAGDQFTGIASHAQSMATAATALGKDAEKIVAGAKKLGAAKDMTAARAAFGEVSQALSEYAEKTKSGFGAGVRLAYCPMADKPWLQRDKEIKNPYYGASMISCGSFKN